MSPCWQNNHLTDLASESENKILYNFFWLDFCMFLRLRRTHHITVWKNGLDATRHPKGIIAGIGACCKINETNEEEEKETKC